MPVGTREGAYGPRNHLHRSAKVFPDSLYGPPELPSVKEW